MPSRWPDPTADYDRFISPDAQDLWQDGIDKALQAGELKLRPRLAAGVYDLDGKCPRCDHHMRDDVHFEVIGAAEATTVTKVSQNIVCNCTATHEGRREGEVGCGWAPDLRVNIATPETDGSPKGGQGG